MPRYAEGTTVQVEKTQAEIVQLLKRYKASAHGFMTEGQKATVAFQFDDIRIRFMLFIPTPDDPKFSRSSRRSRFDLAAAEERRLWRSLLLVIKAKLESVDSGIETVEEAFLAQTVLPNDMTLAQFHHEALKPAIAAGKFPGVRRGHWGAHLTRRPGVVLSPSPPRPDRSLLPPRRSAAGAPANYFRQSDTPTVCGLSDSRVCRQARTG